MALTVGRSALAARLLGPSGRGEFTAIQVWPMFLAAVGILGLPDALLYVSSKKPRQLSLVLTSWLMLLPMAVLLMIAGYFLIPHVMGSQSAKVIGAARVFLLVIPLVFLSQTSQSAQRAWGDFPLWNGLRTIKPVLYAVALVLAWLVGNTEAVFVAKLWLLANLAGTSIIVGSLRRYGSLRSARLEMEKAPGMLKYGAQSALGTAPELLNSRLDQLVLVGFLGAVDLGLYTIAVSWSIFLLPIADAVASVMFPYIAQSDQTASAERRFSKSVRMGLLVTAMVCGVMFILAPLGIPLLFGGEYRPAVPAAAVLTVAAAAWQYNRILRAGLKGLGHPVAGALAEGTALVFTVLLLLILLPRMGILGAAIASLVAYLASGLIVLLYVRQKTGVGLRTIVTFRQTDVLLLLQHAHRLFAGAIHRVRYRHG
jgi:O-antigen/teichoic acid export membrane protein